MKKTGRKSKNVENVGTVYSAPKSQKSVKRAATIAGQDVRSAAARKKWQGKQGKPTGPTGRNKSRKTHPTVKKLQASAKKATAQAREIEDAVGHSTSAARKYLRKSGAKFPTRRGKR